MKLITLEIAGCAAIVVTWDNLRLPDAVFTSAHDAAAWAETQAMYFVGEPNRGVAICNGRLIRARDCFSKRHFMLALQDARRGKPVGERFGAADLAAV
jgi:hypothetical protein